MRTHVGGTGRRLDEQRTAAIVEAMADHSPGALRVGLSLAERHPGVLPALKLLGLRGPSAWLAYKDVCGEDLDELARRLREDPDGLRSAVVSAQWGRWA
jgi:hypothetical protein